MRGSLMCLILCIAIGTAGAQIPSALQKKFPQAASALPFIQRFPVLAKLLAADKPWELPPGKLVAMLFPQQIKLVQGSEQLPLLFDGKRTVQWPGLPVWDQFAYETEYYVFDPARPVIRLHIGRP